MSQSPKLPWPAPPAFRGEVQVAGGPMLHVPVLGDCPEHLDEPIAPQVHLSPSFGDFHPFQGHIPLPIGINLPVAFQLSQPMPAVGPTLFRFSRLAYQLSKRTYSGANLRSPATASRSRKWSFLLFPLWGLS